VAGTIHADLNGTRAHGGPPDRNPPRPTDRSGPLSLVRPLGGATKAVWERHRDLPERIAPRHLSTRDWLARASFALFAIVVVLAVVLMALGLLSGGEAAGLLLPVVAMAAGLGGFALGADASREDRR
jgi:hypothetical protein